MKITKDNTRLLPCPILNRHLLSCLVATAITAAPALPAGAQENTLGANAAKVPTSTVVATVPLSGTPAFMVLNPDDTFVYVSTHISSSTNYVISRIDTKTHAVVTTFPLAGQPGGLAVTPSGKQL